MTFEAKDIPDQSNKVAIVTGSNTGIGYVSALELARKGAHVILACRSEEKGKEAAEKIKKETGNDKVEFMKLDLSSFKSVSSFVEEYRKRDLPIHTLINNAGVMMVPFGLTEDGLETQIGTNHFGHALLTLSLMDIIEKSQPARIVMLSSLAHQNPYSGGVIFDKINDAASYSSYRAYGQSKLCNILFANALAERVKDKQIYVNSVHPGYVATELQRNLSDTYGAFVGKVLGSIGYSLLALTPEKGALTSLYVATSEDIIKNNWRGQYFVPTGKHSTASSLATDKNLQERLWSFTFEILKSKLGDQFQPKIN